MTTTVYNTASSLDGFIATPEHSLEWLLHRDLDPEGPGNHTTFMARVGATLMGASTYTWVARHAGDDPWAYDVPTWVLTHRAAELEAARPAGWAGADIRFVAADDDAAVRALHAEAAAVAGDRDVWVVGGGELAARLADVGLLDEVVVAYAPVVLGAGAPLLPRHLELALRGVERNADFVVTTHDVVRGGWTG
ncbi:dihydrofolate reductase family protein [Nocardioides sp. ChNu-153]|uniref:dihydrofolate reductase family protein n=1 Tax=unclassified Nocardioides TaxID=2615069 RepID=UPI00240702EB|nr:MULTISPECIES: dihydrofolate reductase family protein [unclassified Nocardioides]MDN7122358.1 dihydrofolate reductase family protein [Nocardioides sp. ChNu-153]